MHILLGLIGAALGAVLIIKTEWFVQNFGTSEWAETHLGTSGGTRLFYKLIGIGIIFISFLAVTGMLGGFVLGTFGRLFGSSGAL